ncbi:type I restriction-modification system subunit M N-terminal domain-containing protein [Kocuria rhizophila]|uniref:type I restriction-modification system subunit M N-terminal domain-containing protein n=1 Tax=Kocuria rhizophila TaxID=72000 RepID=UPI0021A2CF1A|nr:type I restriction-modification system subunit M N-terminal domain-containing protein [Kocuria rhizophila]MCT1545113.1 type I restriction-modification system subunit M N-terminal domain-containing protein [Kocuria rhizophila]MCT2171687.1 type I restriction-modification system subunit M N-terminal domain-containing protein [Kocuria rhizophila]
MAASRRLLPNARTTPLPHLPRPRHPRALHSAVPSRSPRKAPRVFNHASFIWGAADILRGTYKQHEYGDVILPFTVLFRLDAVLAPTKDAVLEAIGHDLGGGGAVARNAPESCRSPVHVLQSLTP